MTLGGERAVKAAGGVGLETIIHRGQISITTIYNSMISRILALAPNVMQFQISFAQ
jgi:hypothetical protein